MKNKGLIGKSLEREALLKKQAAKKELAIGAAAIGIALVSGVVLVSCEKVFSAEPARHTSSLER